MRKKSLFVLVFATSVLALALGCGDTKKTEPNNTPDPKGPNPNPDDTPPTPAPGEPKYKLSVKNFLKEFATNNRAAAAKYTGAIVELEGNVTRSAGIEFDSLGTPAGKPGDYRASFAFGEPDAKRQETVVVRGLKTTAVGKALRGQTVTVKGRVGKYQTSDPVELLDSEFINGGGQLPRWGSPEWSTDKTRDACTVVAGTVAAQGNAGADYIDVTSDYMSQKVRCYLLEGTKLLYPSEIPAGTKLSVAGTFKYESTDGMGTLPVLRDGVILGYTDPKSK